MEQDESSGFLDNPIAVAAVTVVAGTLAVAAFLPTSLPIVPLQVGSSIAREGRSLPFTLINVCYTILCFACKLFHQINIHEYVYK